MVLVGSRVRLMYISSDFKAIWIEFIRKFNKSFPRKILKEKLQENIVALQKKVEILRREVLKKIKSLDQKQEETKHNLISLSTSLQTLNSDLTSFPYPDSDLVKKREVTNYISLLIRQIKEVKALIDLSAHSYVKSSRRKMIAKTSVVTAGGIIAMIAAFNPAKHMLSSEWKSFWAAISSGLSSLTKRLPLKKKEGLAILISYHAKRFDDKWLRDNAELFIPIYVSRCELAFGQKANIVKKAAKAEDFYNLIEDDSIQNIVLFGHGSWDTWVATDETVGSNVLWGKTMRNVGGVWRTLEFPQRKKGLLVRHTCGGGQEIEKVQVIRTDRKEWGDLMQEVDAFNKLIYPERILILEPYGNLRTERKIATSLHLFEEPLHHGKRVKKGPYSGRAYFHMYFSCDSNSVLDMLSADFRRAEFLYKNNFDEFKKLCGKIRKFVNKCIQEVPIEEQPLLGIPVWKRKNIKGWGRTTDPWDFITKPFGDSPKKMDKLYAMK